MQINENRPELILVAVESSAEEIPALSDSVLILGGRCELIVRTVVEMDWVDTRISWKKLYCKRTVAS